MFALKFRKPHQSALKFGITTGLIGGFLSTLPPTIYICVLWGLGINWYLIYIGTLSITGLAIGFIVGGLMGWYYMNKDAKAEDDDSREDKFFQDLVEKEKKEEKKKRKFS